MIKKNKPGQINGSFRVFDIFTEICWDKLAVYECM